MIFEKTFADAGVDSAILFADLREMDVPKCRMQPTKENFLWLRRNLCFRNSENGRFGPTIRAIERVLVVLLGDKG